MQAHQELEREFASFIGTEHAVAVNTGTAALHLALAALGVSPGDEVIIPDFTMAACAYAVMYCGATPIFIDCDDSMNIDPKRIEQVIGPRTKAIMPVHIYGWPCDMDPIMEIARRRGIKVVEDCSEAHGATYRGQAVGSIGDVGCFSLYRNKIVHAEEGGVITTNDAVLADKMRDMKNMAFGAKHDYLHGPLGFNYRMTDSQAYMALGSLSRVRENLKKREDIAGWYDTRFQSSTMPRPPGSVVWMYPLFVPEDRQEAVTLSAPGVRHFFKPMSWQPFAGGCARVGDSANSGRLAHKGVYLPVHEAMTKEEVMGISERVFQALTMPRP